MAVDNISKFYDAFNAEYDNFQTENEFRDFLKNANRENIDNLYSAFNEVYDNFDSADDMISYLGWADSSRPTTGMGQVEQPKREINPQNVAEGRAMFNEMRASRKPETSSIGSVPRETQQYMEQTSVGGGEIKWTRERIDQELEKELESVKEENAFIKEYDTRWQEYQRDIDNELSGPEVEAKKKWLDDNNEKYRASKKAVADIEGPFNLRFKETILEDLGRKQKEIEEMYPAVFNPGGQRPDPSKRLDPNDPEIKRYKAAHDIYDEASRAIRKLEGDYYKNLPIIAISANAYNDDVQMCLDAGMNAHVAKPFQPEELLAKLKSYI